MYGKWGVMADQIASCHPCCLVHEHDQQIAYYWFCDSKNTCVNGLWHSIWCRLKKMFDSKCLCLWRTHIYTSNVLIQLAQISDIWMWWTTQYADSMPPEPATHRSRHMHFILILYMETCVTFGWVCTMVKLIVISLHNMFSVISFLSALDENYRLKTTYFLIVQSLLRT
jgi:hypothetical protein